MMKKSMFVLLLVCGLLLSVPAKGAVTMTPSNLQIDSSDPCDMTFSFDFLIMDPYGVSATAFQCLIDSISGPGTLTFDGTGSSTVETESDYWVHYWRPDNSAGITTIDHGDGSYTFGDNPDEADPCDPLNYAVPLAIDHIMARFAFEYDTPGDYIVTLDLGTSNSFLLDEWFGTVGLDFDPGLNDDFLPGGSNWFTVTIPEPATLMLFGLGTTILLRKRRA